jgi:RNA polymerase-binding transcription factor DksA
MAKKAKAKKASKPAKKAAPAKKSGAAKKAAQKPKSKSSKPAAAKKAPAKKPEKIVKKVVAQKAAPKKEVAAPVKKVVTKSIAASRPVLPPIVKVATAKPGGNGNKKAAPVDNRSRYSDAELKEFKILINSKLEEATRDYELLKNTLSHKDDHGTDDTSPTFKLLEDGSDVLSKEETAHLAARQEKYIQNLKNALIRIENKIYGICRVTGKLIPKERLRSVPHATLSIDAKLGQNR